jgi:hypothetical protein
MNHLILCRTLVATVLLAAATSLPEGQNQGSQPDKPAAKPEGYWALIGGESPDFERGDPNPLILAGKPTTGTVVIWLNGDPVGFYTDGIAIRPLHHGLRTGKNELTISGKHDGPVYVVIARGRPADAKSGTVAGKRKFSAPGAADRDAPLVFEVAQTAKMPERERLGASPKERAIQEKEIRALLGELQKLIADHKGQEAVQLLNAGLLLRAEAEGNKGIYQEEIARYAKEVSDPATKIVDADRPVQLLFGERAVLVYGQPSGKSGKEHALFTIQSGEGKHALGPLQLARVGGRWVIWNAN